MKTFRTGSLSFLVIACGALAARADKPSLEQLRKDFALKYLEPGPHIALAKYHHDKGNRLLAFYILETARRTRFEQTAFDDAFRAAFVDSERFDNSKEAEAALLKKHAADPKSLQVLVKLADIYISREDYTKGRVFLRKAIELQPENFTQTAALAEVERVNGHPKEAAKTIEDYLAKYPKSVAAFNDKIGRAMRDDKKSARKLLEEALKLHPNEGDFHFNLGVLLQDDDKLDEAEAAFVKAAALSKDSTHIQSWVGRFFLKVRMNEDKALVYYLNAYFIDPHFRDTEYAESRIRTLNYRVGQKTVAKAIGEKKTPKDLLHHENPVVVGMAVAQAAEKGDAESIALLIEAMEHDDGNVRWQATDALLKKIDRTFDPQLRTLLKSPALRKRGLAAYLAIHSWGKEGIEAVKPWLDDEAQILRFDAISALLQEGGAEGRALVLEHKKTEKNPWLLKVIESVEKGQDK